MAPPITGPSLSVFLLFFSPSSSPPHHYSQNTSCCFPTRHFGLWSACLKWALLKVPRCSDGRSWGCFIPVTACTKQHDELMKCHDHVIELGFYFPDRLPKQKSLSLDIQWWHMVVSPFHPRFWFVITKAPILMRWYTDSDTCLADFYEVYMWLNIRVRIVLRWLFHQLTVGYVFYFLYYLLPWRMYWSTT